MKVSRTDFMRSAGATVIVTAAPAVEVASIVKRVGTRPFLGANWPVALTAAGGAYHSKCGAWLDRTYYWVGSPKHPGGYPLLGAAAAGYDRSSGRWLAAIPLHCGGTAAATQVAVFAHGVPHPEFITAVRQGSKSSVFFKDGLLHVATAVWGPNESLANYSGTRVVQYDFSTDHPRAVRDLTVNTDLFRAHYAYHLEKSRLRPGRPIA